jgi:hypothetical protein
MKIYINLNKDNFVEGYGPQLVTESGIEIEITEEIYEHFQFNFMNYKFENNQLNFNNLQAEKWDRKGFVFNRINQLKSLLAESDWKVVVNAELLQVGLPIKYLNLHEERQVWRDEINKLEEEIVAL